MASSPDSRLLSQDNHDSRAEPEKKPYEPPAIEYEEEFERVMLACCVPAGSEFKPPTGPALNS